MATRSNAGIPPGEKRLLWIIDLGRQPYERTWELQKRLVRARLEQRIPDVLLLLEHDPVFTLGRHGRWENLLLTQEALEARDIACIPTERGGDVTYHGPGQLVVYPVVRVPGEGRKVRALVEGFEEVLLRTLALFGIQGRRNPGNPGVWVGQAKIGSVGIAVRTRISFHGFCLNVDMDLAPFSWIHTCGQRDLAVTSLSELVDRAVPLREVKKIVASRFVVTSGYRPALPAGDERREAETLGLPPLETRFNGGVENAAGWVAPDGDPQG